MNIKAQLSDHVSERERRNQLLALEVASEGIVLLENNGVLPLAPCRIALYGGGAQHTIAGGSGSGEVNARHNITVLEGLEQAGFEVLTHDWIDSYDRLLRADKEAFLKAFRRRLLRLNTHLLADLLSADYSNPSGNPLTEQELSVPDTDTCLYVLSRQSGEGHDRMDDEGSFRLDITEVNNIRLCASRFARLVLVINTGAPIDLSPLYTIEGVDAIVYMGQLGMEGGRALAAILTGEVCPSGRLAVTWPQSYADVPFGKEFGKDPFRALYKEGIYVGYRYYDSFDVSPRYPFGYGRSYTSFEIGEVNTTINHDHVCLRVEVKNTGERAGKQVVQLYASCPGADREYQLLVAFAKTDCLKPKASQTMELVFAASLLSRYDESSAQTLIEAGRYMLRLGFSSRDTQPVAAVRAEKTIVSKHKNLCTAPRPIAELHHNNEVVIPEGLPEVVINAEDIRTQVFDYTDREEPVSEAVKTHLDELTPKDYARFAAGTGLFGERQGFHVPGSVGHTTAAYIDRGIPNAEMCDGPAGIRIDKRSVLYPSGKIKALDASISLYEFIPSWLLKTFILGNPNKGQMLYQFVTGFPVEAMVAQTWNTGLVERLGRAVSEEMSEYGVMFWLAPALNIVRNPLCGRNFEYYSEDPLLSGRMAAAITRGVQATKGNYVTIKHLCANNQENNRYYVSSDVDERVLREIYWKGFEIVVREASPRSVMTAYNKLNGVYCPNSRDLCMHLLRHEWGFDGVVMTDWFSTGDDRADEPACINAGVDIIMPGGRLVVRALQKAYRAGILSANTLRTACARLLRLVIKQQE